MGSRWGVWTDWRKKRNKFSQEFPVPYSDSAGSINTNTILIKLLHLYDCASTVPFFRMVSHLILYTDTITDNQRLQLFGVCRQTFGDFQVSLSQGLFPVVEEAFPSGMGLVFAWMDWDEVSNGMTKDADSGGQFCVLARCVAIGEHSSLKTVCV